LIPTIAVPTIPALDWWRIIRFASIFLIALIALWAVLSARSAAKLSATEQKLVPMRMTLSNLGNVATGYLLRGDDPGGILSFRFSLNGVALGLPPVARLTNDAGLDQAATRPSFGGFQLPKLPQSMGGQGEHGENGEESGVDGALDKLEEASEVSTIIVSILNSIASILPRSLAQPIRMVTRQIRSGQTIANRAKSIRRNVDRLNKTEMGRQVVETTSTAATQVGQAATSEATRAAVAQGVNRTGAAVATVATGTAAHYSLTGQGGSSLQTHPMGNGANGAGAAARGRQWVYLPPINPGDTVTIDVMVGASGRNASGDHQPFRILSRALGDENAQPVVEEGSIRVAKASPWPSLLRFLVAGLVVLVAVALIWGLLTTLI
jgi:hypothetical protein